MPQLDLIFISGAYQKDYTNGKTLLCECRDMWVTLIANVTYRMNANGFLSIFLYSPNSR